MIKLFKKKTVKPVLQKDRPVSEEVQKERPVSEVVQEIHDTFYSEVDRILEEANIKVSTEPSDKKLVEKTDRLKALGFIGTKDVEKGEAVKREIALAESMNIAKEKVKKAVQYFSHKYPQYKFITEESVKKICEKYGLVYGQVEHYQGDVPDANLEHMENFKINEEDVAWEMYSFIFMSGTRYGEKILSENEAKEITNKKIQERLTGDYYAYQRMAMSNDVIQKCPLEIAAPKTDFDTKNMDVSGFKITKSYPDPVVLQPVVFERVKYYLIVTAWGLEASDEAVVNHKMN